MSDTYEDYNRAAAEHAKAEYQKKTRHTTGTGVESEYYEVGLSKVWWDICIEKLIEHRDETDLDYLEQGRIDSVISYIIDELVDDGYELDEIDGNVEGDLPDQSDIV